MLFWMVSERVKAEYMGNFWGAILAIRFFTIADARLLYTAPVRNRRVLYSRPLCSTHPPLENAIE